ncbi:hypothetical protein ACN28S_16495 [Cystobacter fuscus]
MVAARVLRGSIPPRVPPVPVPETGWAAPMGPEGTTLPARVLPVTTDGWP